MRWRLIKVSGRWAIQYKTSTFSRWQYAIAHRSFSFEPEKIAFFSNRRDASKVMAELVEHYS